MDEAPYDYIIVGSGIAGLYMGVELLRAKPKARLAIFERGAEVGGRAYTFHKDDMQWEAGAGRISKRHTLVLGLMKRYKLTFMPISGAIQYKDTYTSPLQPSAFEAAIPIFLDTLTGLPAEELATHTIRQLMTRIHGPSRTESYLIQFPYRAETDIMRADMALDLFRAEMRTSEGYGICKEGLSALTGAMRNDIEARGGTFFMGHDLVTVAQKGLVEAVFKHEADELRVKAHRCVLAISVDALRALPPFKNWSVKLRMTPLLRFYGVFPPQEDGKQWYEEYGRVVTSTPIRHIIPSGGAVQMSYTEGEDAMIWIDKINAVGEKKVGEEILGELRKLLKPSIPAPTFVRAHVWEHAVTYWLPGNYDPVVCSKEAMTPLKSMPAVHVCGESFSVRQGWLEGAVEHAAQLLRLLCRH